MLRVLYGLEVRVHLLLGAVRSRGRAFRELDQRVLEARQVPNAVELDAEVLYSESEFLGVLFQGLPGQFYSLGKVEQGFA